MATPDAQECRPPAASRTGRGLSGGGARIRPADRFSGPAHAAALLDTSR
ncbi:hypothetical protein ABZ312_18775 [Streptomyces sp. NPDC006207]